jgi:hypothetical protein
MTINVSRLEAADRAEWEVLYHGYAEFYQVPIEGREREGAGPDALPTNAVATARRAGRIPG